MNLTYQSDTFTPKVTEINKFCILYFYTVSESYQKIYQKSNNINVFIFQNSPEIFLLRITPSKVKKNVISFYYYFLFEQCLFLDNKTDKLCCFLTDKLYFIKYNFQKLVKLVLTNEPKLIIYCFIILATLLSLFSIQHVSIKQHIFY